VVRQARERGVSLTGPDGLLKQCGRSAAQRRPGAAGTKSRGR